MKLLNLKNLIKTLISSQQIPFLLLKDSMHETFEFKKPHLNANFEQTNSFSFIERFLVWNFWIYKTHLNDISSQKIAFLLLRDYLYETWNWTFTCPDLWNQKLHLDVIFEPNHQLFLSFAFKKFEWKNISFRFSKFSSILNFCFFWTRPNNTTVCTTPVKKKNECSG